MSQTTDNDKTSKTSLSPNLQIRSYESDSSTHPLLQGIPDSLLERDVYELWRLLKVEVATLMLAQSTITRRCRCMWFQAQNQDTSSKSS